MARAAIRLLGGLEAYRADGSRVTLPTRKSEALLAILALAGEAGRSRERLAGLLWGDRGEAQARHSLSQSLTSLRNGFGEDSLVSTRDSVGLAAGRFEVDALDFLRLADAGDAYESLDAAARLYRGVLLDGFVLREEGFSEWLSLERQRLHDRALDVLRRLAAAARRRAEDAAARAALERALALDPLCEEAHRDLMRLHLDHGHAAEAVRHYTACAEILRRELQVEPGAEIQALWREAMARGSARGTRALGPGAEQVGERKQVTALAVALFASRARSADPEDLEALLAAAAREAAAVLRRHGGLVLRASPEGLSAVFGAPQALEDHATRACLAAIELCQDALLRHQVDAVGLGVGLDSSEVVLHAERGDVPAEHARIFGPCLQRATRLAGAVGAGEIATTEATRALTRGRIRFRPAGVLALEPGGLSVPLHRPEGTARPPGPSGAEGALVEREAELASLAEAVGAAGRGEGRLLALVGEAGVGKSRLVREFVSAVIPKGWHVIVAAADPQSSDAAYATIASLLRAYFEIGDDITRDPGALRTRIARRLTTLDPGFAETALVPLLALLGAPALEDDRWAALEPAQRRRRMLEALKTLLHLHAAAEPLLVAIEDLHWLDAASRQALESLVESLAASRLVVLVNFRPEFTHAWAGLGHYRQLRLQPLTAEGTQALLDRLLGQDPSVVPLRSRLAERAGGNPFFLEECVRRASETPGLLEGVPGEYRLAGDPDAIVLPATVQAVIAARMDRLSPDDKRLLQVASVLGSEPEAALLRTVSGLSEEALEASLARLQSSEFLVPLRIVPEVSFRFRHALTHEVTYGSLLRQDRRELHLRVLRALEQRAASHRGGEAAVDRLAFHASRAEAWEAAAAYGRRAGMRAAARSANREAVTLYGQALAALRRLPEDPERRGAEVDLLLDIRNALFVLGEPEAIPAKLEEASRIANAVGDRPRQAQVGLLLSGWYWQSGQREAAAQAADRAIAIAAEGGDATLTALGLYRRGANLKAVGEYRPAEIALGQAVALLESSGAADCFAFGGHPFVFCSSFRSWALAELGDHEAAREVGARGWSESMRLGNSYSQAVMSFGYGHALIRAGALAEAEAVLERGLELYRIAEVPSTYPWIAACLGYVRVAKGHAEAGLSLLRHAVAPEVRRRGPLYAHTWLWLADAALHVGRREEALAAARMGRETAQAQSERGHLVWAERILGDVLSACDPTAAAQHYRFATENGAALGMRPQLELAAKGLAGLQHLSPSARGPVKAPGSRKQGRSA
ncbi:MAG TPA: AAA family ATPase [Acetobacteraceae bacterium]|nr:AAA family ATPase [Acetobacteraceae bacterium]